MKNPKHKYFLLFIDWLIILYAYFLSIKLQIGWDTALPTPTIPLFGTELLYFFPYSVFVLFIFEINRLYQINVYLKGAIQLQAIIRSQVFSTLGLVFLLFFIRSGIVIDPRIIILYFFVIGTVLMIAVRMLILRTFFKYEFFRILPLRRALILSANSRGIELAEQIINGHRLGIELVGFLDDSTDIGAEPVPGYPVMGRISEYESFVREKNIDELILCSEDVADEKLFELIENCAHTEARVLIGSEKFTIISKYVREEFYGDIPLVSALNSPPYLGWNSLKRLIDIVFATLGIVVLSPLFAFIAVGIKLNSRGPILYRQTRLGKNGKPFTFFKFRSMEVGSDSDKTRREKLKRFIREGKSDDDSTTKIVDDCKVTRMGKLIRKTSIDELPQLLNVIRGEMSLVGPRPCLPYEWDSYNPWHKKRLSVTPGCTGIWQVSARSEVGFHEMVLLDIYYIYNISLHLDIWVMLKTIPVMLFGTGGK